MSSDFCKAYWAIEDAAADMGLTMDDLERMAAEQAASESVVSSMGEPVTDWTVA